MSDEETGGAGSQLEPYSDDSDNDRRSGEFRLSAKFFKNFKLFSKCEFSGLQPRFSLRILNLPKKPKENHLRESIKNEYKKFGQVRQVELQEKDDNRVASVFMGERKEVKRAVEARVSKDFFKNFFWIFL